MSFLTRITSVFVGGLMAISVAQADGHGHMDIVDTAVANDDFNTPGRCRSGSRPG